MKTRDVTHGPFGNTATPAPRLYHWIAGIGFAFAVHAAAALPFLPDPQPQAFSADPNLDNGIPISLAPPPLPQPPEPEPEPEPEEVPEPVLEERSQASPPPAPPALPREVPDLPDIEPQIISDLWSGSGGGTLGVDEYLSLRDWFKLVNEQFQTRLGYPIEARKQALSGRAKVVFTVNRAGRVIDWTLADSTGHRILDRAIEQAAGRSRQFPPLPETIDRQTIVFALPIVFELIFADPGTMSAPPAPANSEDTPSAASAPVGLTAQQIGQCAAMAAELTIERDQLLTLQDELVEQRAEYERLAERAVRSGAGDSPRLRRLLRDFQRSVETYEAGRGALNMQAESFQSTCQGGQAEFEAYQIACAPYLTSGNVYCQAYEPFWERLRVEGPAR